MTAVRALAMGALLLVSSSSWAQFAPPGDRTSLRFAVQGGLGVGGGALESRFGAQFVPIRHMLVEVEGGLRHRSANNALMNWSPPDDGQLLGRRHVGGGLAWMPQGNGPSGPLVGVGADRGVLGWEWRTRGVQFEGTSTYSAVRGVVGYQVVGFPSVLFAVRAELGHVFPDSKDIPVRVGTEFAASARLGLAFGRWGGRTARPPRAPIPVELVIHRPSQGEALALAPGHRIELDGDAPGLLRVPLSARSGAPLRVFVRRGAIAEVTVGTQDGEPVLAVQGTLSRDRVGPIELVVREQGREYVVPVAIAFSAPLEAPVDPAPDAPPVLPEAEGPAEPVLDPGATPEPEPGSGGPEEAP